jgi:hypothetical protein
MTNERPRVGLALAGGVVRAPIHAGALIVLIEAGIPIDLVAMPFRARWPGRSIARARARHKWTL